jgi:hypothetical protein
MPALFSGLMLNWPIDSWPPAAAPTPWKQGKVMTLTFDGSPDGFMAISQAYNSANLGHTTPISTLTIYEGGLRTER